MAPHSSTLAWKIPWTEEPGGLQSMGSRRAGHDWATSLSLHFHALEKEMAIHSSVLASRIPGMGETGGLPSMGSHRVGHDWSNTAAAAVEHSLALTFFGVRTKTDLFQFCGHCWVFRICWHIECSTLTAPSFRILKSSAGIPLPPLA